MMLRPTSETELADAVTQAFHAGGTLAITGGGSTAGFGAPVAAPTLDMTAFSGVVDYDPAELVLTVRAGTPLREVQALVAEQRQMLAFEPFDHGALHGDMRDRATIGGVVAGAVAGSQRLSAGGARDHLLGFRAVSGRGDVFVAGAKVVKNVTGFDLPKLAAGSRGRLFAMTELTLKVLPRAQTSQTLALLALDAERAVQAMSTAMGSKAEVAAAAHLPDRPDMGAALTLFRLQGFGPSVAARSDLLETLLASFGSVVRLDSVTADTAWEDCRTLAPLAGDRPLWRINVAPSAGAAVAAAAQAWGAAWLLDWAGGLVWITTHADAATVRAAAARAGGHATLMRGPESMRSAIPALPPQAPGIVALETRIRRAFDPAGVFETGRF